MKRNAIADRYDRVAASAPVNADAARVYNMRGDNGPETRIPEHIAHYDAPVKKTLPPPLGKEHCVGKKYGTITVVGYIGPHRKAGKGALWLVRCVCGQYEERIGKSVERATPDDCCVQCRRVKDLQRRTLHRAYFDRHGKWPP